jgi:ABC-type antimicrobial peptide transport system permease subunit
MADALWPNENPIGKLVVWPDRRGARRDPMRIVGVVADVAFAGLTKGPVPAMYLPLAQQPVSYNLTLVMRGRGGALVADTVVRALVHAAAPSLTVSSGRLTPRMREEVAPQRKASAFMGAFGAVALFLAALGLYGIIAQGVLQRTRELAVRAALGASPRELLRLVLSDGLLLTATGAALGAVGSAFSVRVLRAMYPGLDTIDLTACAAAITVLLTAALAASYLPARRAAALNVTEALRAD